jgi:HD-GYP domain-containing protein (c-di-GMP phosphodiesterase class II)
MRVDVMQERRKITRRLSDVRRKLAEEAMADRNRVSDAEDIATIGSLAHAIEARDPYTRGHSERVGSYAAWLAKALHFSRKKIELLTFASRLHDIGKVSIPDSILLKPGRLTPEERAQIQLHPVHSIEILRNLKFIRLALPFILHHHERYDGQGYPYGLKGKAIPLEARILAVADAFDAMLSDRPYRQGLKLDVIVREFKQNSGKQFDPEVTKIFLVIIEEITVSEPGFLAFKGKAA